MSLPKLTAKILGTHMIAVLGISLIMSSLMLIFDNIMWYQILVSLVLIAAYWGIMLKSIEKYAVNDVATDKFNLIRPTVAAFAVNIPNILFIVADCLTQGTADETDLFKLLFRYWNSGYVNALILLKDRMLLCITIVALYFVGFALLYYRGVVIKNNTDTLIKQKNNNTKIDND